MLGADSSPGGFGEVALMQSSCHPGEVLLFSPRSGSGRLRQWRSTGVLPFASTSPGERRHRWPE
jgi:hypothetical protein